MTENILTKGGPFMYLILVASIVGLAIIIERFIIFAKSGKNNTGFILKIKEMVLTGRYTEALAVCDAVKLPVSTVVKSILVNRNKNREDLEKLVQAEAQREIPYLENRLTALNTIATIAPLLGLLGTVSGMIKAFGVLAKGNIADAALAGHISEALLTTAAGLLVAIPCIIAYNYFEKRLETLVNEMEIHSTELIDSVKQ